MNTNIAHLLNDLEKRLPELEWRMRFIGTISEKSLPRGLFRSCINPTPSFFIQEIKTDIHALVTQESYTAAHYLANRIHQKINNLISICQNQVQPSESEKLHTSFTTTMSSRKEYLENIEQEINALVSQQSALEEQQDKFKLNNQVNALLKLQTELGNIEKRLTLAREEQKRFCDILL